MDFPDDLKRFNMARAAKDPRWPAGEYEDAVLAIEDHSDSQDNPYFGAPAVSMDALPGGLLIDEFGGEWTPEDVRSQAFQMLALADLAEVLKARL